MTRELFFDTNILIGYILSHDRLHNKCCQVFNLENNKHTCEVVEGEVDKVLDRARGVYDRLIQITAGGDIDNIDLSPFSPKKQDMIKSILAQLPQDNVTIQYFNLLKIKAVNRKNDAFSKLGQPLINRFPDETLADEFQLYYDIHYPDDLILNNYCQWGRGRESTGYLTDDGQILENRDNILDHLRRRGFEDWRLSILSIPHVLKGNNRSL